MSKPSVGGEWVGGLQVHKHAPSWPNLQVRICKNSSQVEVQVGPEYGTNYTKHTKKEMLEFDQP